jgi:hypothetical protein
VNLSTSWTDLNSAFKTVREHWEEAKTQWNDPVRDEFEEHYWNVLEAQVRSALRGIERLVPTLVKMRQECA